MQVVSSTLQQVCKYQAAESLMFTDLVQLNEVSRLDNDLLANYIRPVKSTTCIKSFLAVHGRGKTEYNQVSYLKF